MADIKDFFSGTTVWQMGEHSLFMCNLNFTVVCETISNVLGISFKVWSSCDQGIYYTVHIHLFIQWDNLYNKEQLMLLHKATNDTRDFKLNVTIQHPHKIARNAPRKF